MLKVALRASEASPQIFRIQDANRSRWLVNSGQPDMVCAGYGTVRVDLIKETRRLPSRHAPIISAFSEPRKPVVDFGVETGSQSDEPPSEDIEKAPVRKAKLWDY